MHVIRAGERVAFVYGTLRRGQVRDINRLAPKPAYLGVAWVAGALFDLGAYPGLRIAEPEPSGAHGLPLEGDAGAESVCSGWVKGELYSLSAALECQLDEIEGVWPQQTGEYLKRDALAFRGTGPADPEPVGPRSIPTECFLYEIASGRAEEAPRIAGGDWVAHVRGQFGEGQNN